MDTGPVLDGAPSVPRDPFIEGWLDDRYASGLRPVPASPPRPMPDAGDLKMTVRTSFTGARDAAARPRRHD